jgi:hypothetical protein
MLQLQSLIYGGIKVQTQENEYKGKLWSITQTRKSANKAKLLSAMQAQMHQISWCN